MVSVMAICSCLCYKCMQLFDNNDNNGYCEPLQHSQLFDNNDNNGNCEPLQHCQLFDNNGYCEPLQHCQADSFEDSCCQQTVCVNYYTDVVLLGFRGVFIFCDFGSGSSEI